MDIVLKSDACVMRRWVVFHGDHKALDDRQLLNFLFLWRSKMMGTQLYFC